MSAGRVRYFAEASRELEDAFEWYLDRSPRAAEAFLRETNRAIGILAAAPGVWPRFEAGTRRYVLSRFPYDIIYRETDAGIEVIAISHHKRRPRHWHRRLGR